MQIYRRRPRVPTASPALPAVCLGQAAGDGHHAAAAAAAAMDPPSNIAPSQLRECVRATLLTLVAQRLSRATVAGPSDVQSSTVGRPPLPCGAN